jgi:hypothetical protein
MIFVFGANEGGKHGGGAAYIARTHHGAIYGVGYGRQGDSFGIPTKDAQIHTLPLEKIEEYVKQFIQYAKDNPELDFKVTQIGCGLAGLKSSQVAPMFAEAPRNCSFDTAWSPWLPKDTNFWGTYA